MVFLPCSVHRDNNSRGRMSAPNPFPPLHRPLKKDKLALLMEARNWFFILKNTRMFDIGRGGLPQQR